MSPPALTLQDFQLSRALGRGDTSQVRLALDPSGREVAVKLPLPQTLEVHQAAERFGNEVRLTLRFRHPHLVRGYAGVPFGPGAFLALEYYPGGTLSDRLAQPRTLPTVPERLRILADLASALTYLHGLGAVHQDVKPQNVYVQGGRAALGDLGSTYFLGQGGKVSGSPYYMAPEIYHGEASGGASDVYSLAVTAYELLTGSRPFAGESYEELMVAHLTRFPAPLARACPELPRPLTRLFEQAFAKRAEDRPTADALHRELRLSLGDRSETGHPDDERLSDKDSNAEGPSAAPPMRFTGRHPLGKPEAGATPPSPEPSAQNRRWNPFKRRG